MSWLSDWLRRRHQRAVLRRLAKLDAKIAQAHANLVEMRARLDRCCTISNHDIYKLGELAGKVGYLEKIRAHNLQHEDVL